MVYNPPAGSQRITVEAFTNLSLAPADPNYAPTQINSLSKLIIVPSSFAPSGHASRGLSGDAGHAIEHGSPESQ